MTDPTPPCESAYRRLLLDAIQNTTEFDDEDAAVSGADLVEFFANWRERVKDTLEGNLAPVSRYILIVRGGIEIECEGPYDTNPELDRALNAAHKGTDRETDGVFELTITPDGWPTVSETSEETED